MTFKRRKINQWIFHFGWMCRQGWKARSDYLTLDFNRLEWQTTISVHAPPEFVAAAAKYASYTAIDLFTAWQSLNWLITRNQCETQEDWIYATYILTRYYSVGSSLQGDCPDKRINMDEDKPQGIPRDSSSPECDQLQSAGGISSVPAEVLYSETTSRTIASAD